MRRAKDDHLDRWRELVFTFRGSFRAAKGDGDEKTYSMTDGVRVLLLKMHEHMDAKGIVSVPRSVLARELGIAPARVSERIHIARGLGLLDVVRRPRPGVTAVYQAKLPAREVRDLYPVEVRDSVRVKVRDPYLSDAGEPDARGTDHVYPSSGTGPHVSRLPAVAGPETSAATTTWADLACSGAEPSGVVS